MASLISIPILGILVMLQVAIFSNLHILNGSSDLVFLAIIAWTLQEKVRNGWVWALVGGTMISLISAVPLYPYFFGYVLVTGLAMFIKQRIWQIPALAMFIITALGTIFIQLLSLGILIFWGTRMDWLDGINLVILPSVLLNLILALPVYLMMTDLAGWIYPVEYDA